MKILKIGGADMAKGKYEYWLSPEGITRLEDWARNGLTDELIARNIGINVGTLYDWKKKYPEISESLKKGKEVVDAMVESALLNNALSGDTTAQVFWLKNRRPEKWREKNNIEVTTNANPFDGMSVEELRKVVEDGEKGAD